MIDFEEGRGSIINPRLAITRAFALIDVLRRVDESVPLDLVLIYLSETDASGLIDCLFSYDVAVPGGTDCIWETEFEINNKKFAIFKIPDGVKNMAKEYAVRCFWDQLNFIRWRMPCTFQYENAPEYNISTSKERVYPGFVLEALKSFQVSETDIESMDAEIKGLYTNIIGKCITEPERCVRWIGFGAERNFDDDIITREMQRKINHLNTALSNTCDRYERKGELIPLSYREALFDALELSLMFSSAPCGFREMAGWRSLQEFEKLGNDSYAGQRRLFGFMDTDKALRIADARAGFTDRSVRCLSKLTPNAAICLNRSVRLPNNKSSFIDLVGGKQAGYSASNDIVSVIDAINPNVDQTVRLYMTKELAVARSILNWLDKRSKTQRRPCGGCCDPCEPAPSCCSNESFYPCLLGSSTLVNCI